MAVTVTIDENGVVCRRGESRAEGLRWHELRAVLIETTDQGPFQNDVFWVLVGERGRCVVPQEAEGSQQLLARLQHLAGFDNEAVVEAMGSAENRTFVCWRRPEGA
ncbi:MAG: hypothetical protein KIT16_09380 [Rhodospirillaceae bacterium]|nr:hypothetical protein [Rhodospirillaceae bacterium]